MTSHDVAAFWDGIDEELAAIPAAPEEMLDPLPSSPDFANVYQVKLTSIENYRITAYLSVPTAPGPHPALFMAPGYASVVTPPSWEDKQRYVTLTLRYRGTRGADKPYAGKFPGMLTDGIADPNRWMLRGMMADALRAFEYLLSRPEVDRTRVGIQGNDAGLLVAARRPGATAIALGGAFFHRLSEVYPKTEAYPIEEINDHLRAFPEEKAGIDATLDLFDPIHQAGTITAPVNITVNDPGASGDAGWFGRLSEALGGEVSHYQATHEGQTDRDAVDAWLSAQLGVRAIPKTWNPEAIGAWS